MRHDIIAIGASAGGVEAMIEIVGSLRGDLPASLFLTQHFPSEQISSLPAILNRHGSLHAVHPQNGDPIVPGKVFVAPPNLHLLLNKTSVSLSSGPKEHGYRPSIDNMFRSAAAAFGDRVVGVILTGMLDDGVVGLQAIKDKCGMAMVQDPLDAFYRGMPTNAIKRVKVDLIVPLGEIGAAIMKLVDG